MKVGHLDTIALQSLDDLFIAQLKDTEWSGVLPECIEVSDDLEKFWMTQFILSK